MSDRRSTGFWVIMVMGIALLLMLVLGQTMAFINYDFAVSIGLQESKEVIGETGVAVNKGFGVGDTLIYLPLLILGLVGLWFKKLWGVFAMTAAMAITAYWPVMCMFILFFSRGTPGFHFTSFTSYTIILTLISFYGLWGIGYLYKHWEVLVKK